MGYSRKIIGKNRNLKKRSRKGGMSGESVVDVLKRHNKESKSAASTALGRRPAYTEADGAALSMSLADQLKPRHDEESEREAKQYLVERGVNQSDIDNVMHKVAFWNPGTVVTLLTIKKLIQFVDNNFTTYERDAKGNSVQKRKYKDFPVSLTKLVREHLRKDGINEEPIVEVFLSLVKNYLSRYAPRSWVPQWEIEEEAREYLIQRQINPKVSKLGLYEDRKITPSIIKKLIEEVEVEKSTLYNTPELIKEFVTNHLMNYGINEEPIIQKFVDLVKNHLAIDIEVAVALGSEDGGLEDGGLEVGGKNKKKPTKRRPTKRRKPTKRRRPTKRRKPTKRRRATKKRRARKSS